MLLFFDNLLAKKTLQNHFYENNLCATQFDKFHEIRIKLQVNVQLHLHLGKLQSFRCCIFSVDGVVFLSRTPQH